MRATPALHASRFTLFAPALRAAGCVGSHLRPSPCATRSPRSRADGSPPRGAARDSRGEELGPVGGAALGRGVLRGGAASGRTLALELREPLAERFQLTARGEVETAGDRANRICRRLLDAGDELGAAGLERGQRAPA